MNKDSKIYIAGHNGMVGSAVLRKLQAEGYSNLIYRTSSELDLTNQQAVKDFFDKVNPEYVFLAAAKVGGINANNIYRADFIYTNVAIQTNVIHQAYLSRVKKLMFLGSVCIYPKIVEQPIKEEYLLKDYLEHTNEPYAIAKIAGLKMCQAYNSQYGTNFISIMPANLYGPNDYYDLENSHVLPALIRRFHEAKINDMSEISIWGSGSPRREFLHADDLADALLLLMLKYNSSDIINVGVGYDISIKDLASLIAEIVGYKGNIKFDLTKPDGTPERIMDSSKINNLGWLPKYDLPQGLEMVYSDFIKNYDILISKKHK